MLQRLFTWTIIAAIWKRYGRALKLLPVILVGVFIISLVHDDYVRYAEVSNDRSLLHWSFLIKWFLILAVVVWYWQFAKSVISSKKNRAKNNSTFKNESMFGKKSDVDVEVDSAPDPFAEIRNKKRLRSKADIVIERERNS